MGQSTIIGFSLSISGLTSTCPISKQSQINSFIFEYGISFQHRSLTISLSKTYPSLSIIHPHKQKGRPDLSTTPLQCCSPPRGKRSLAGPKGRISDVEACCRHFKSTQSPFVTQEKSSPNPQKIVESIIPNIPTGPGPLTALSFCPQDELLFPPARSSLLGRPGPHLPHRAPSWRR